MRVALIRSVSLLLVLLVTGCAFSVPEENPITPVNVTNFNKGYPNRSISRIGFNQDFPNPVEKDHPLYKAVTIGKIEDVPDVIRNINIAIASSAQFEEALQVTLNNSFLYNKNPAEADYVLNVKYIENDFFGQTTRIQYLLSKKGESIPLLDRKIRSEVIVKNAWGGMTWQHARTATRLAHTLNLASITWCLEQYDGAAFPQICDLDYYNLDK
ncbi:MAG: hypothetical protein NXI13_02955 [Proteobacteria bacterium]|nr:hypothetical protein [Pseudomonadota bacterium]